MNRRRHIFLTLIILLICMVALPAWAGVNAGGGGGSVTTVPWNTLGVFSGYLALGFSLIWNRIRR